MNNQSDEDIRASIIGLGEKSIRKSYYPLLQKKIKEIEELNKSLEEKIEKRTKELREQKQVFESLFNDTADAQALIKNGEFIDCNKALLKILKYEKKEDFLPLRPHKISPLLQPDGQTSQDKELHYLKKCMEKGHIRFEWVHKKSTGEEFWVDVLLTKIVLNGEINIFVVWRDITKRKALQEELNKRNEELEEYNYELYATIDNLKRTQEKLVESAKMASLGGLVAGVASEIHKPTDVSVTAITFLQHTIEEAKENINNLNKEDISNLISTLEDLAKIVNNNLNNTAELIKKFEQVYIAHDKEAIRTINIKNYLQGIILGFKDKIDYTKYKINIKCDENINIEAYPEDYTLIFTNLINNSLEHAFKNLSKGSITINISQQNDSLKIKYKNDGHQLKEDDIKKLFDPFFTNSTESKNLGLGLNIVYNVVNKLNGTISCTNLKNSGVRFSLSIPIKSSKSNLTYNI